MEYFLIFCIVAGQIWIGIQIWLKTNELESLFNSTDTARIVKGNVPVSMIESSNVDTVKTYIVKNNFTYLHEPVFEVTLVDYAAGNKAYHEVKDFVLSLLIRFKIYNTTNERMPETIVINDLNNYLIKNKGAVADYHLIKDIVDRNIDSIDEEINNYMPAPLYLGLAATMGGIILGLFSIDTSSESLDFTGMLNSILGSVKVAMIASVIGLALTTALSIFFYRPAKVEAEKNKNKFLSFLQVNLLPELIKTEVSGISTLNDRLRNFSKELNPAIKELVTIINKSYEAVRIQAHTIDRVEQLDNAKVAKANVTVFKELSKMMDTFQHFALYYHELNRSMVETVDLTNNLKALVGRTVEVEKIAKGIDSTLTQSKELNKFLSDHFIEFKSREVALESIVDEGRRSLNKSVNKMADAIDQQIQTIQSISIEMEPQIKNAFEHSIAAVQAMSSEQISKIEQAFSNSRPQFEKLDKLVSIDQGLQTLAQQGKESTKKQELMINAINNLAIAINESKKVKKSNNNSPNEDKTENTEMSDDAKGNITIPRNSKLLAKVMVSAGAVCVAGALAYLVYAFYNGSTPF